MLLPNQASRWLMCKPIFIDSKSFDVTVGCDTLSFCGTFYLFDLHFRIILKKILEINKNEHELPATSTMAFVWAIAHARSFNA